MKIEILNVVKAHFSVNENNRFCSKYSAQIHTLRNEAEEIVVKKVLKQLLGRDPTIADAKKCTSIFHNGNFEKYEFIYDNLHLGAIHRKWLSDAERAFDYLSEHKYVVMFYPVAFYLQKSVGSTVVRSK